jgi:hypothetical protein
MCYRYFLPQKAQKQLLRNYAMIWPHLTSGNPTNKPRSAPQICQIDLTPLQITTQYVEFLFFLLQYVVYFVDKPFYELYGKKIQDNSRDEKP